MWRFAYASATNRNMPYIVTTKRPDLVSAQVRNMHGGLVTSRRAVATLEDAQNWLRENVDVAETTVDDLPDFLEAVYRLTESGGTVGPLPDGTVIEVEHWTWEELRWQITSPVHPPCDHPTILDAYNARQQ